MIKHLFAIIICAVTMTATAQVRVFEYGSEGNDICYRIPAIATASNGDVVSVADYRYCSADIGYGRLSLHARISHDNGRTWGPIIVIAEAHEGQYGVQYEHDAEAGFGDPAIVADRESSNLLLLSCCGNVTYQAGTAEHHQGIARFRSTDNGRTWSEYEDIEPAIYQMFRNTGVEPEALFIGSGRIFQSRYVKVGDSYRLYCVVLMRTRQTGGLNYVIYSDDFGETWSILGHTAMAGVTGGDEPKAEELPNGSVVLSSRWWGRIFNIFDFSDVERGEGQWQQQAISNATNVGVVALQNACNGEIMLVPVRRTNNQQKLWLALQSVPFGPGRTNVGIYYKALYTPDDYNLSARLAAGWDGRYQVSTMSSAYSTMTLLRGGAIGFLYEESTFGRDYSIIYKSLSINEITGGRFEYCAE